MAERPVEESTPDRPVASWDRLRSTGLLWLINAAVLHPRGFALSLEYAAGETEPCGWSIIVAPRGEPWQFAEGTVDEQFQAVEALFEACREHGYPVSE